MDSAGFSAEFFIEHSRNCKIMEETMDRQKKGRRLAGYRPDYVVFDLETTGLSPVTDRIIEISAVKVKDGKVQDTFSRSEEHTSELQSQR